MSHDPYGELTSAIEDDQSVTAYAYDLAGHLTGIDRPGTADDVAFGLDALGRFRKRDTGPSGTPTSTDTYSYLGTSESAVRIATTGRVPRPSTRSSTPPARATRRRRARG
jgi:YD repeat-containing protein